MNEIAANVESMFYVRVAPWHGLGVCVEEALTSRDALEKSGLDWTVAQRSIMTSNYNPIPSYKANIRETDNRILGVVTDRYKIVQNHEAFAFVDGLLGEGVRFETAGSLNEGRKVWMLAKLPDRYTLGGEEIEPYLIFSNSQIDCSELIK
jgi:phage/plasmid-like protein (TIGR03299 family)